MLLFEGGELGAAGAVLSSPQKPGLDDIGQRGRGDVSIQNLLGLRTNRDDGVKAIHFTPLATWYQPMPRPGMPQPTSATGVVEAARVIVEANRQSGQDPDVVALLEDVYKTLDVRLREMAATQVKDALTFAQELMKYFTAEDLERDESVAVTKVQLMMREEFERPGGVSREALAKYLDEVLPVMDQQDERIQSGLETATTPEQQAQIVQMMMQRTKERMQIEFIRDCAAGI